MGVTLCEDTWESGRILLGVNNQVSMETFAPSEWRRAARDTENTAIEQTEEQIGSHSSTRWHILAYRTSGVRWLWCDLRGAALRKA